VTGLEELWIEGNPYYERMEGVVAGTPSLAEYDVILDAGSSAAEDPESAVPFDLTLSDGRRPIDPPRPRARAGARRVPGLSSPRRVRSAHRVASRS
jgi:hypothetical protein